MTDRTQISRMGSASRDEMSMLVEIAFNRALGLESCVSDFVLDLEGMSGRLYRMFINNLVRMMPRPRYLEVGSWTGSTSCSAMDRNVVKVQCIDNWSEFNGPKDQFFENTSKVRTENVDFAFLESDFRKVDASALGSFNIYLFDGPHSEQDQYDGLALFEAALDNDFVFIVDDWNWKRVRDGTFKAIEDAGYCIDFCIEVRSTLDDEHVEKAGKYGDWHNGYFLSKLSRRKRRV